jgi:hypothetical protein
MAPNIKNDARPNDRHGEDAPAHALGPFLVIALSAWLLTSPFQYGFFDAVSAATIRDITQKRGLWQPCSPRRLERPGTMSSTAV